MAVTTEFLKELPKCEHHVHLEGTLSPELLFELAKTNNIELPNDFPADPTALHARYQKFTGLDDFLGFYYIGMNVLITQNDFESLAWDYFKKCKDDGVVHAEVFFDPQAHLDRGIEFDTIVNGFTKAQERAEKDLGITTKLIMCVLRHLPVASGVKVVQQAAPYFKSGAIQGLGLDSSEKNNNPLKYAPIYEEAKKLTDNIRYTAHAGEEGPAQFVEEALDVLEVERIDHGVRAVESEELLQRLAKSQTLLTTCPLSNLKLRVVSDIADVPYRKLLDAGIAFSINCDDPAYFGGYCLENYVVVQEKFNFDVETWCKIVSFGINGSWISDEEKQSYLDKLEVVKAKYLN